MAVCLLSLVFAVMNAGAADLKTIKPGVLTVAFNGDMPGTSVKDGKLIGLDGEMMQWVAEGLGLKVEPVLMEWSAEIAAVEAGRADIMHGMMGWSAARTKVLLMSDPIYYQPTGITQKKGQNWQKMKDLEGKRVGTITGFAWVDEMKKIPNAKISLYDTSDAAIRDLLAGRVDALIADGPLVEYAIVKNPGWNIHQLPLVDPGRKAEYPILTGVNNALFAVNKQSGPLLDAINKRIAGRLEGLQESGGRQEIRDEQRQHVVQTACREHARRRGSPQGLGAAHVAPELQVSDPTEDATSLSLGERDRG